MQSLSFRKAGQLIILIALVFFASGPRTAEAIENDFDRLQPRQRIADFWTEAVYENEGTTAIGSRFRHVPSGFVLDVLRIQSVPQAFVWVNSPPTNDKGEPHTLEHLLLGKGTKGRYVASLEEMCLGNSSAFTEQARTCYHFNTAAGPDVFYDLFEEKLNAMLHPNFTDEEIRREVCNMGVAETAEGTLRLEEKGTVYNEMVSTFERPWGNLYKEVINLVYGEGHPLALSSGGVPAAIRELTPEEIRHFHGSTHHLNNMGAAISIGNEVELTDCLTRISRIFERLEPDAEPGLDPADLQARIPDASPAPEGTIWKSHFPHRNTSEPGVILLVWPPDRPLAETDDLLLGLFLDALASGQTSNLYGLCIDSQTRVTDFGASSVFSWVNDSKGMPVFIGFGDVDPTAVEDNRLDEIRTIVTGEIARVAALEPGSADLVEFNDRVQNLLSQTRKSRRNFLNSPPRWGFRGTGSAWIDVMQSLHIKGGFRRNLALNDEIAAVESALRSGGNPWTDRIKQWQLDRTPLVSGTRPEPEALTRDETAREDRIASFTAQLRDEFGVETDEDAVLRYSESYDANTAVIDAEAEKIEMPGFVENPPLTLDGSLDYAVSKLPGGGPLVASRFDNMTSATAGIVLRLDTVPPSHLPYVSALSTYMLEVGVLDGEEVIPYDEFSETLRKEVLELDVYPAVNSRTQRVELTIRGAGSELAESERALHWMNRALFSPDLRPENLPRIRDAVDRSLSFSRNRMRRSEESWVQDPARSYWRQSNPLLLSANSFLTQTHALLRNRWLLKEAGAPDREAFAKTMNAIVETAAETDMSSYGEFLSELSGALDQSEESLLSEPLTFVPESARNQLDELSPTALKLVADGVDDLQKTLTDLPPDSFQSDLNALVAQMDADLAVPAETALARVEETLDFIRRQDNARAFLIGNSSDMAALTPGLTGLVADLASDPAPRQEYGTDPRILDRVEGRGGVGDPDYIGLVNESTRAGVHIHTADCASYETSDNETLLDFLSARVYGGGGAHSMFMKTWAAGLAYSNGLRSNENTGRLMYYAERCPDLPQTLQFVVDELEKAPADPRLADYAVAQAFVGNRSASGYAERGEAMAADLADDLSPEKVRAFRESILELSKRPDFYETIHDRMAANYGNVLPGFGTSTAEARERTNANYFVIGPEKQLRSWEEYLQGLDSSARLERIYPRDFWLVAE